MIQQKKMKPTVGSIHSLQDSVKALDEMIKRKAVGKGAILF